MCPTVRVPLRVFDLAGQLAQLRPEMKVRDVLDA